MCMFRRWIRPGFYSQGVNGHYVGSYDIAARYVSRHGSAIAHMPEGESAFWVRDSDTLAVKTNSVRPLPPMSTHKREYRRR